MTAPEPPPRRVGRRRRVLYLSGFDPRGPAFYHKLYRDEAAKAAALNGYAIQVGPRRTLAPHVQAWTVTAEMAGERVETAYEFLRWDDIIREHWARTRWEIWRQTLWAYAVFWRTGALPKILAITWPAFITFNLPTLSILAVLLGSLLALWAVSALVAAVAGLPFWAGIPFGLVGAYAAFVAIKRALTPYNVEWIGRIHAFTIWDARGQVPGFAERRAAFAEHLVEVARGAADDEVLVVGHSLGAPMAISVVAEAAQRDPELGGRGPALSLLTLGQTTPILSYFPDADWFRRDLVRAASIDGLSWTDFTSPPDGACSALTNPVTLIAPDFQPPPGHELRPKLLNARFMDLIGRDTYARVKRDRMRLHFQYLMAGERPAEYDYFAITAGPLTLADRYAARPSVTDYTALRPFNR